MMTSDRHRKRRTYLKQLGVLTGSGALTGLAGCSSGSSDTENTSTGTTESSGSSSVRGEYNLVDFEYDLEDTLNVFQWTDYWPEGTVDIFQQAYGVEVNVANYASNEEMFNKLKAGGSGQFDVIFPSDYMINILAEQQLIKTVDKQKLPKWNNLEQRWIDEAPYDPGEQRYSVPYQWGTSGIATNTEMADANGTTWDTLWNDEYEGQITMLNDMRETIGVALKRLGYSLNTTDEAKIQEAKELLIQQKPLLLTYDSVNMKENLINKQASPIHSWSGDAFSAYWELFEDDSSPVKYRIPEEGGVVWVDTAAITANAKHPNAAHAFINFTLNAKINAMISNYVYYPTPNEAAKAFVDEAALTNPAIYPPEETMQKLEFIENIGQATKMYSEAWTEIQNA